MAGNIRPFPNREGQIWVDKTPYYNITESREIIFLITDSSEPYLHKVFILYKGRMDGTFDKVWEGASLPKEQQFHYRRIL
jgi:hypothetical protein